MKFKDKLMERFSKFLDSETSESESNTQEDSDASVEVAKEIITIANKADDEFSGGADEKIQTILELAKKLNTPLADETTEAESVADEAETQEEGETLENGDSINIEEIAEAVAEVVEKVTEQKLKEFTDSQKKEAQKALV